MWHRFAELYMEWNEHDKEWHQSKKKGVPPGKPNYEITVRRSQAVAPKICNTLLYSAEAMYA